jgi:serine/threonine protein kinase
MYDLKTKKKHRTRIDKISKTNIDSYKIIKELGYGFLGTVYLVEKNKKKYGMKIEHVLESDVINKDSKLFRENRFYEKFANKYPEHFVTMKEFDIIDNCKHIQKYPRKILTRFQEITLELERSKFCIRRIITLIDGSLGSIINTLSVNQIYSALLQIYCITNLMHKNKYVQVDAHINNVGYIKTDKKYIKIDNYNIPTFGYIYKLYDFGFVLHITDTVYGNFLYNKNNELLNIITYFYENNEQYIYMFNRNKFLNIIKKSDEFEDIQNILQNKKVTMLSPFIYIRMYEILNHKHFKEFIVHEDIEKYKPLRFPIPREDILYYIKEINNDNNSTNIINYFLKKIT